MCIVNVYVALSNTQSKAYFISIIKIIAYTLIFGLQCLPFLNCNFIYKYILELNINPKRSRIIFQIKQTKHSIKLLLMIGIDGTFFLIRTINNLHCGVQK